MNIEIFAIAIDGPAGAGKSTIAKLVSKTLSIDYIDTGAMYRALTLKVLEEGKDPKNKNHVINVMENTDIDFSNGHIYLDGKIVDMQIRENTISQNVSYVSTYREVRKGMVQLQQKLAETKSVVMDGRDIGTVVLPKAKYKFFITASPEERARRRYKELVEKGDNNLSVEQIRQEIETRDEIDSTREVAPLKQSPDAHIIDNTHNTIEESVEKIISIVKGR